MKVCDKCRKNGGVLYQLTLKGKKADLCDACSNRILEWLQTPEKIGLFSSLFGVRR